MRFLTPIGRSRVGPILGLAALLAIINGAYLWLADAGRRDPDIPPADLNAAAKVKPASIASALIDANSAYKFTGGIARRNFSTIHRLGAETAIRVDEALHKVAGRSGLPANYLAAYVIRESTGDPGAEFRNPAQWDAAKDARGEFAATDHGLVQISGRNLMDRFPGLALVELKAKAEDVDFAVDFLADYVASDLDWAARRDTIPASRPNDLMKARSRNPYWLAALAYNRGREGALVALSNPRACRHADLVISAWAAIDERTGIGPGAGVRAPVFTPVPDDDPLLLAAGDVGPRVQALQSLLNARIAPDPALKTDGNFGPATRAALVRFQQSRGLEPTGVSDPPTWEAMMGLARKGTPAPLVRGDTGPDVESLQGLLNDRVDPRPGMVVDGHFGPATGEALVRFQRSRGIDPSGAADASTWEALGRPRGSR